MKFLYYTFLFNAEFSEYAEFYFSLFPKSSLGTVKDSMFYGYERGLS